MNYFCNSWLLCHSKENFHLLIFVIFQEIAVQKEAILHSLGGSVHGNTCRAISGFVTWNFSFPSISNDSKTG